MKIVCEYASLVLSVISFGKRRPAIDTSSLITMRLPAWAIPLHPDLALAVATVLSPQELIYIEIRGYTLITLIFSKALPESSLNLVEGAVLQRTGGNDEITFRSQKIFILPC